MNKTKILNIVVAGIQYQNKWLLIRRERGDYTGKWALVGGKMEFGETIEQAIKREIKEETGLDVNWLGVKAIINERLLDKKDGAQDKHFLITLSHTISKETAIQSSDEGDLNWFSIDEIKSMEEQIIPSDFLMIIKLLTNDFSSKIVEVDMSQDVSVLSIEKWEESI